MTEKEEDRLKNFQEGHVCPDREPHHGYKFATELSHGHGCGIGTNIYIRCNRCNTQQDVTAYGSW